jgi:hypothetical protein
MERTMRARPKALKKKNVAPIEIDQAKRPPVDLVSLFRNPTAIIEVPDPRYEDFVDSGIRIEVSSKFSDEALKVMEDYRNRVRLADEPPVDEALLDQLVSVTKRWWHAGETTDGIYLTPGELLACTPENKRMVFTDPGWRWLRNFVLIKYTGEANFFGKRPKTD